MTTIIDSQRLRNDITPLIADCIYLKRLLGSRWTRPMAEEQRRLTRTRRTLTNLFVLLAVSRRRLHIRHAPREVRDVEGAEAAWVAAPYNEAIAARLRPDYAVETTMREASL